MPNKTDPVKTVAARLQGKAVRLRNLVNLILCPGVPSKRNRTALRNTMEEVAWLLLEMEMEEARTSDGETGGAKKEATA